MILCWPDWTGGPRKRVKASFQPSTATIVSELQWDFCGLVFSCRWDPDVCVWLSGSPQGKQFLSLWKHSHPHLMYICLTQKISPPFFLYIVITITCFLLLAMAVFFNVCVSHFPSLFHTCAHCVPHVSAVSVLCHSLMITIHQLEGRWF